VLHIAMDIIFMTFKAYPTIIHLPFSNSFCQLLESGNIL
jgi:hypothetical protein